MTNLISFASLLVIYDYFIFEMTKKVIQFSSSATSLYFDASFNYIEKIINKQRVIIITDEHLYQLHLDKFNNYPVVILNAGESNKNQSTINKAINQLIKLKADRKSFIIGVGGGVVTDMAGFISCIYMRGVQFGFVPTTILAMVDASIGGKNGIDIGNFKNMIGIIRQPKFVLYDYHLLHTLPDSEWINGFAEIIKHACIKDASMFKLLEENNISTFKQDKVLLNQLIMRNALLKSKIVADDELESGNRKLLNFGHTLAHAIENDYRLPHGYAVSIGMVAAAWLSAKLAGFNYVEKLTALLAKYGLPVDYNYNAEKALKRMQADKKRVQSTINYVLLKRIGKAEIKPLQFDQLAPVIHKFSLAANSHK